LPILYELRRDLWKKAARELKRIEGSGNVMPSGRFVSEFRVLGRTSMMKLSSTGENRPMAIDIHSDLIRSDLLRSDLAARPEVEALDDESEKTSWVETVVTVVAAAIAVLLVSFVSVITAFA
jgi:hypothetical protein